MADNEHVIVGATRVVCVVKRPSPMPSGKKDRQLLANLPVLGHHGEDIVALVAVPLIARLRKLGAEVTVIDADPNAYAARIEAAGGGDALVASVEEQVAKGKADLAIAQAGGGTGDGKA